MRVFGKRVTVQGFHLVVQMAYKDFGFRGKLMQGVVARCFCTLQLRDGCMVQLWASGAFVHVM